MAISKHTSQNSVDTQLKLPKDAPSEQTFEPRRLTVGEFTLTEYGDPREFVPPSDCRPTSAPYLRLAGKWLERAGFTAGAKVRVDVSQGRLVIEPIPQFPERSPRLPRNGKKVFL